MPIQKLISECDNLYYESRKCSYTGCSKPSILSHTIPENYLKKLNEPLTEVLTFQSKIGKISNQNKPQYLVEIDKSKFSTFKGFCESHDNDLFLSIDNFNGEMNREKATLNHYRNICYGVNHIKTQMLREGHISNQNYRQETNNDEGVAINKLLKQRSLKTRLSYCLNEHLSRKVALEKRIKSRNFEEIEFIEIQGSINGNPIFSGRSSYLMHKDHNLFDYAGYSFMPWITYQTLLTYESNHLVFCWLKKDSNRSRYLRKILNKNSFENTLAVLAYGCSDSLALTKNHFKIHHPHIEELILNFRVY